MNLSRRPRLRTLAVTTALVVGVIGPSALGAPAAFAGPVGSIEAAAKGAAAAPSGLTLQNSFVSSVGWVKPGDTYPSRIIVTNPTQGAVTPKVKVKSPTGTRFVSATGPGKHPVQAEKFTWSPGALAPGATATLVLRSKASTTSQLPTVVWRDISSTAVLKVGKQVESRVTSHGPKVIPPSDIYDTARYGDRPFPVVPVQYLDRKYQANHSGEDLDRVINDPSFEGSTFNLFQEMSLKQLFPEGTVPSAGIGSKDFTYGPGFNFTRNAVPGNSCKGTTLAGTQATPNPLPYMGTAAYPERITEGVYNLPGQTEYYGSDSNGSAVIGAVGGVGALQNIDSGCGDTGKLVYDSAVIADPEIDYSDYDTDKDGVVDFFMVVFAGCGGNGSSQLTVAGCDYPDAPYDNVWPHSSSLENGYRDPATGLPGYTTDDQLKNLEGKPLWYTDDSYDVSKVTTTPGPDSRKVFVRVGPYNVNPETAIDFASVISHEYGHSLGLPDFYSTGSRETYGDWNLMATDKSHHMDAYSRQELGWVVPEVLDSSRTVSNVTDSKQDTGLIRWKTPNGNDYTLQNGRDGTVHNSQMFVAKLPGRKLLEESAFGTADGGVGATPSHLWWSGSGNDFGCAPNTGRNFDLSIPELRGVPAGSTVTLKFKSRWDIEWDFDYGFVLTTIDQGVTYQGNESEKGYTTPATNNPNTNSCLTQYQHGVTGSSGSYDSGNPPLDRVLGNYPAPVFLEDEYDISELAGQQNGALRFSYSTDPGLARPGWFIDDVKVTVDEPTKDPYDVLVTDFESSGGPEDPRVFNGGCQEDLTTAQKCTLGWKFLQAGAESEQDHAYYMEMRDRSGFDLDGNGQADRGAPLFEPGFYLAYTDESHGYGNVGTDNPPAQSPLDSTPTPESDTPNLNDAAFTAAAARSGFSDSGNGHTDNYDDPSNSEVDKRYPAVEHPWRFRYECLTFKVNSMSGQTDGPQQADGDLTGNVAFNVGSKCGKFNYGYGDDEDSKPVAKFTVKPKKPFIKSRTKLSAKKSTGSGLKYSWNFHNGGKKKDAKGIKPKHRFKKPGYQKVTLTVTDSSGRKDTAKQKILVRRAVKCMSPRVDQSGSWRKVRSSSAPNGKYCDNLGSGRGPDTLTYQFRGPQVDVYHGTSSQGGKAAVYIDGKRRGTIDFGSKSEKLKFKSHHVVKGLSKGTHTVRVVVLTGRAYIASFITIR